MAITNKRLKTADPAMLPIVPWSLETIAPITLVTKSGIEEPNAIIVAPAISDLNLNYEFKKTLDVIKFQMIAYKF